MSKEYKNPLERIFGDKGLLIVLVMIVTITMTMFVAFFELRRLESESQNDLMVAFSKQREEMQQIKEDLQAIYKVARESPQLEAMLYGLRSQLDIMRRDFSALNSDVDDELKKINETLEQIRVDLKTAKGEQPDKP